MTDIASAEIEKAIKALRRNGFSPVEFVASGAEAARRALELIPVDAKVGHGGSTTIKQLHLAAELKNRGTTVLNALYPPGFPIGKRDRQINRDATVYLSSSNAITLDGKLVNIDGTGNRVGAMFFGPEQVVLIVGQNKIVCDVDEAVSRIKNVIAPWNNRDRGKKVPCAKTLRCTDCKSPDRSCRVTVIVEKKPRHTDIAILLVGEDLGLGWNPEWPKERIDRILADHLAIKKNPRGLS